MPLKTILVILVIVLSERISSVDDTNLTDDLRKQQLFVEGVETDWKGKY